MGKNAEEPRRVNFCRASLGDGECFWEGCPQIHDGEPAKSGRHCPLDKGCPRCLLPTEECEC